MQLTLSIPALLFPAISLTMLAYNARYLAIAALILAVMIARPLSGVESSDVQQSRSFSRVIREAARDAESNSTPEP